MRTLWLTLSILVALLAAAGFLLGYIVTRGRGRPGGDSQYSLEESTAPSGSSSTAVVAGPAGEPTVAEEGELGLEVQAEQEKEVSPSSGPTAPVDSGSGAPPAKLWRSRLTRAREALGVALSGVFRTGRVDSQAWDALEEALLGADVGVKMTMELVSRAEKQVSKRRITDPEELVAVVKEEVLALLDGKVRSLAEAANPPSVYLFAGVNGTGKTTSIAKLAERLRQEGGSVVIAAADTYRAAATEQLAVWAGRVGAQLVKGSEGADPGAVVFDAIGFARARGASYLLVDTAGRLHTNVNLMEELKKIVRVAEKAGAPPTETLLVIDATTGQNGLSQAARFLEAVEVTGIVLTKLDGSARGGIVLAIEDELGVPVKLVGIGESAGDLVPFEPAEFADALFGESIRRP